MTTSNAPWTHYNPVRVTAGAGSLDQLPSLARNAGGWLLLTSPGCTRRGTTARIRALLEADGTRLLNVYDEVGPNPDLDAMESLAARFRGEPLTGLIALGGGSVLDATKLLAVTIHSSVDRPLHLALREDIGGDWRRSIPLITIPTTSGTGSEVTPFATVWDTVAQKKHSVMGDALFPDHCILDPLLTLSLPYDETLYTGLDATSHALESLWNHHRTSVSESLAIGALQRIAASLPQVLANPADLTHRQAMQEASHLAGMAISQTRTAIAHSMSYPLTLRFGVPHGLACGFTLAAVLKRHIDAIATTDHQHMVLEYVLEMLSGLELDRHLERFASQSQVMDLIPSMLAPERAGNFVYPPDIAQILRDSLNDS